MTMISHSTQSNKYEGHWCRVVCGRPLLA